MAPGEAAGLTVTLDHEARHLRRRRLETDGGEPVLLDLPEPVRLGEGDALVLEDGTLVAVRAAPEPLLEIEAADGADLARLAWHLGNRHVATQVLHEGTLRVREDHVIDAMLRRLGARVRRVTAPFEPEPGAYAGHAHG